MVNEINTEIYLGLPKIEGLCLLIVTAGETVEKVSQKSGEKYKATTLEGVFDYEEGGTSHFGKHKFDQFGEDGHYLLNKKGHPMLVDIYKKNGSNYSNMRIVGPVKDFVARADDVLKSINGK